MHSKDKKMAVLDQLRQATEPLSLKKLIQDLEVNFAERSVRRWLAEMVKEGIVEKRGNKRGTCYQFIQQVAKHMNCHSKKGDEKTSDPIRCSLYQREPMARYFDEIRVRYRQERRTICRDIIALQLIGNAVREHVSSETKRLVKQEDRDAVFEDVMEDFQNMSVSRAAGLGIPLDEVKKWLKIREAKKIQ